MSEDESTLVFTGLQPPSLNFGPFYICLLGNGLQIGIGGCGPRCFHLKFVSKTLGMKKTNQNVTFEITLVNNLLMTRNMSKTSNSNILNFECFIKLR